MSEDTKSIMGRPRVFDTEEKLKQLEELMKFNPRLEDTAAFFKCSERTIDETIRERYDLTFREFREQHLIHTKLSLIRKAVKEALGNNNTMLIFALKNLCGWQDKIEHVGNENKPIHLKYDPTQL